MFSQEFFREDRPRFINDQRNLFERVINACSSKLIAQQGSF